MGLRWVSRSPLGFEIVDGYFVSSDQAIPATVTVHVREIGEILKNGKKEVEEINAVWVLLLLSSSSMRWLWSRFLRVAQEVVFDDQRGGFFSEKWSLTTNLVWRFLLRNAHSRMFSRKGRRGISEKEYSLGLSNRSRRQRQQRSHV